jgi:hypothetical protein
MMNLLSLAIFLFSAAAAGSPLRNPFEEALGKRQTQYMNALQVDLGYSIYQGSSNTAGGVNTWKG